MKNRAVKEEESEERMPEEEVTWMRMCEDEDQLVKDEFRETHTKFKVQSSV